MEVKNLFEPGTRKDIADRINKLTADSQPLWGKMSVAKMLAHLQKPIGVAFGTHQLKGNFILQLIGPFFKSVLYNDKPYKHGLPTDKSFIIADAPDFDKERENLLEMLSRFEEVNIIDKHPLFGKLTKEQWSMATWKHLDHHLQQFGV